MLLTSCGVKSQRKGFVNHDHTTEMTYLSTILLKCKVHVHLDLQKAIHVNERKWSDKIYQTVKQTKVKNWDFVLQLFVYHVNFLCCVDTG